MSDTIKRIKSIILSSSPNWQVKDIDDDQIIFTYIREAKKADCSTSCCMGVIFLPVGILYAILGGSDKSVKQVTIRMVNGKINIDGNLGAIKEAYKALENSDLKDDINDIDELKKKIKKAEPISFLKFLGILCLIILGLAIISSLLGK